VTEYFPSCARSWVLSPEIPGKNKEANLGILIKNMQSSAPSETYEASISRDGTWNSIIWTVAMAH
jgi:hypothetical protein